MIDEIEMPSKAHVPSGINHFVLNVRDIEESHDFWTTLLGFRHVGTSVRSDPPGNPPMRFYSGERDGKLRHHDVALYESPALRALGDTLMQRLDHLAIEYATEDAWRSQLRFLTDRGIALHSAIERGFCYSVLLEDPNGISIELLYELPRKLWESDIQGALNSRVRIPSVTNELRTVTREA